MFETLNMLENSVVAYGDALRGLATDVQNFQTAGYKSTRASFVSMFTQEMSRVGGDTAGRPGASNVQSISQGTVFRTMGFDFSQGGLIAGDPLNAGIAGNGLFVMKPDNLNDFIYTRASDFVFAADGTLEDTFGRKVMGFKVKNGVVDKTSMAPITVDPSKYDLNDVGFETGGVLTTNYSARQAALEAGDGNVPAGESLFQLALADVPAPSQMDQYQGNAFRTNIRSGDPLSFGVSEDGGLGTVVGGQYEGSNIDPAEKTIVGIQYQRGYNAVQAMLNLINRALSSFISIVDKA